MKYLSIFLLLVILFSCHSSNVNSTIYPEDLFTKSEVEEISLMLENFTQVACKSSDLPPNKCLKRYFEDYWTSVNSGNFNPPMNKTELSEIIAPLSADLKSKLFYEVNANINHRIPNTKPAMVIPDSINYLELNVQKIYLPLISHLAKKYPHLNKVKESILNLEVVSSSSFMTVYSHWNQYDYSEKTDLLFLSLFIITQADEGIERNLSYSKAIEPIQKSLKMRNSQK